LIFNGELDDVGISALNGLFSQENSSDSNGTRCGGIQESDRRGTFSVEIPPPLGELIVGSACPPEVFEQLQKKYAGFNQSTFTFTSSVDQLPRLKEKIQKYVNINCLTTDFDAGTISFFGTTVVGENPVLFFIKIDSSDTATCQINCGDSILSSLLTPLVKKALL